MTKNLKLSFILLFVFSSIIIAWRNLTTILNGTGITFVALLAIVATLLGICLTDNHCFKRIKDLFFTAIALTILESIIYFACEFPAEQLSCPIKGFLVTQNIFCILAILFFAYTTFRFIVELKELKLSFIEFILGNGTNKKKIKKSKEIFNGSLEEKPISLKEIEHETEIDNTEDDIEELEDFVDSVASSIEESESDTESNFEE